MLFHLNLVFEVLFRKGLVKCDCVEAMVVISIHQMLMFQPFLENRKMIIDKKILQDGRRVLLFLCSINNTVFSFFFVKMVSVSESY